MVSEPGKIYSFKNYFRPSDYILPIGSVIQVEELALDVNSVMTEHIQMCDEITYVISGKAKSYCDGECTPLSAGDVHFINRGYTHSIVTESSEKFRYICIGIVLDNSYEPIANFNNLVKAGKEFAAKDGGDIRILSELLLNEFYTRDSCSDLMINLYLTQIFTFLYRLFSHTATEPLQKSPVFAPNNYSIYNVLRYIDREYMNITSVKAIAKKLSYNEHYLSHMFKDKMGISIKQYITQKKIAQAEILLETTELDIESIATQLNFSSAHSFYQAFRRYHPVSPINYRKKFKEKS